MAKKEVAEVQVVLKCVYSGAEGDPGPGSVITVAAEEAERLFSLGAAEAYTAPSADDATA